MEPNDKGQDGKEDKKVDGEGGRGQGRWHRSGVVPTMESYINRMSSLNPHDIQAQGLMPNFDWKTILLTDTAPKDPADHTEFIPKYSPAQTLTGGDLRTVYNGGKDYDMYGDLCSSSSEYDLDDDVDDDYYYIPVNSQSYQLVYNPESLDNFLKELKAAQIAQKLSSGRVDDYLVVSLDAKWRILGKTKEGAALLIVGLPTEAFIIDLNSLHHYVFHTISPWQVIRVFLFLYPGIVKVGYRHSKLCSILAKTHPSWQNVREDLKMFVDLSVVSKRLLMKNSNFFPLSINECGVVYYVSELVRVCFGKPLNHCCLMSNWDNHRLSKKQFFHATIDALAILKVLEFIRKRCKELGIDFNAIVVGVMSSHSLPCENYFSIPGLASMFPTETDRGLSPKYAKFVVDHELEGLGRQLRGAGFDCLITRQLHRPDKCVQLALPEDRIIITTREILDQIYDKYPEELIYVVSSPAGLGQLEEVFGHFRFFLTDSDIFTRCQICNSTHFVVVGNHTMKELVKKDKRKACNKRIIRADISRLIPCCTEHDRQFRRWTLFDESRLMAEDVTNIRTFKGAPIHLHFITPAELENIVSFLICDECGEVYMDQSKLEFTGLKSTMALPSVRASASRTVTSASHTRPSTATSGASPSASEASIYDYPVALGFPNYEQEYAFALRAGPSLGSAGLSLTARRDLLLESVLGTSNSRQGQSSSSRRPVTAPPGTGTSRYTSGP